MLRRATGIAPEWSFDATPCDERGCMTIRRAGQVRSERGFEELEILDCLSERPLSRDRPLVASMFAEQLTRRYSGR